MARAKPAKTTKKSKSTEGSGGFLMSAGLPDHIVEARFVRPSQMFIQFADGFSGTWTFAVLKLNMKYMKLNTIRAASSGTTVEVKSKWGDDVQLDASSLRILVDSSYAAAFLTFRTPISRFKFPMFCKPPVLMVFLPITIR